MDDGFGDKRIARFLFSVIRDFEADNNTTRALRRLHMKKVHLRKAGDLHNYRIVNGLGRFLK